MFTGGEGNERIFGRKPEQQLLGDIVEKALSGEKKGVCILGPAGIGKTTLLRWMHERAVEAGFLTGFVRAPAAAGLPPRFPVGEILEDLIAACDARGFSVPHPLQRVFDTLRGTPGAEPYPAQLPQIAQALEETAEHAPIGIFIDDFHWAPQEAAELLVAAARVIDVPMLFAVSARPIARGNEGRTSNPESSADLWFDQMRLLGLDSDALKELAERALHGPTLRSFVEALSERTEGNPLLFSEVLRRLQGHSLLNKFGGYWRLEDTASIEVPETMNDVLGHRLDSLDPSEQSVVNVLAILGQDSPFEEIRSALGKTERFVASALTALSTAGLIETNLTSRLQYRLRSPVFEGVVLKRMDPTERAVLHRRVYGVLRRRHTATSASQLAHHAFHALVEPHDLSRVLRRAAQEASGVGSYEEAAIWYRRLAERLPSESSKRWEVLTDQASAMTHFDPTGAANLLSTTMEKNTSAEKSADRLLRRAHALRASGQLGAALADLNSALAIAPDVHRPEIRHSVAVMHGIMGHVDQAETALTELLELESGAPVRAKALGHLGQVSFIRGDVVTAAQLWRQALEATQDPEYAVYMQSNLNWLRIITGDWGAAETSLKGEISGCVARGDVWNAQTLLCSLARLQAWQGDYAAAVDTAATARRFADRLRNPTCQIAALDAVALAAIEAGRSIDAIEMFAEVESLFNRELEPREFSLTLAVFAEAHLLVGDLQTASRLIASARTNLAAAGAMAVMVDRVDAQLLATLHKNSEALAILTPWLIEPSAFKFEQARVHELAAQILRTSGDRAEALTQAEASLALYVALGANQRIANLRTSIAAWQPAKRGRPASTSETGLTPRESEIIQLVLDGKTNAEIAEILFITVGTAKKHVENVKRKVGASRRTQLVSFALSSGMRPTPIPDRAQA